MCLALGPQHSDAGEVRTRGPLVSSQALYHWATVLPIDRIRVNMFETECISWKKQMTWIYTALSIVKTFTSMVLLLGPTWYIL